MAAGNPTSMRFSGVALRNIEIIEAETGLKRTAAVETAIREMAERLLVIKDVREKTAKKPEEPS